MIRTITTASNYTRLATKVLTSGARATSFSHHHYRVIIATRSFAKLTAPGPDPLQVLRETCYNKSLCDQDGFRVPGVHWVFSVAVNNSASENQAPNLRTIGIQRVTQAGIDYCVKQGCASSKDFDSGNAVSILYSQGKYLPGEKAEQWRAEGKAEKIPLSYILEKIPHYTITGMVASKRIVMEGHNKSEDRVSFTDKSHVTEIVQRTRMELENGDVSVDELESSISAYRFCPDRMERMRGGPDSVLWERWEWKRASTEGTVAWEEPKFLLPH